MEWFQKHVSMPNPYGHDAPWLVLVGTKIGASYASLWDIADEIIAAP
jgi:hypothetical protein